MADPTIAELYLAAGGDPAITDPTITDLYQAVVALRAGLVTFQAESPVGGDFVTMFVFDSTATTGGLYAWDGADYTKIGLATS